MGATFKVLKDTGLKDFWLNAVMSVRNYRGWPGIGAGAILAVSLLGGVNLLLFSDSLIQRYAAVFAVGRAMDKQRFAEQTCPQVLLLGNSRVDNALDPRTMQARWLSRPTIVNLGVPGTNARIGYGMLARLERAGCLANGRMRLVMIGLDESYLQPDDSLGYAPFFADRRALLADSAWRTWFGTWLRLWSYTDNLRQLREPEKAQRFFQATVGPLEPVGGAAWRYWGYRAGFGEGNQEGGQVARQEAESRQPPSPEMVRYLMKIHALLDRYGIQAGVTFPPLLHRNSAYLDPAQAQGAYVAVREALETRGVRVMTNPDPVPRDPAYFVNAGHLNDHGAQRYSDWLARVLVSEWRWLDEEPAK